MKLKTNTSLKNYENRPNPRPVLAKNKAKPYLIQTLEKQYKSD